jgi:hypothetical protein
LLPDIELELPAGWRFGQRDRSPIAAGPESESGVLQVSSPPIGRGWRGDDFDLESEIRRLAPGMKLGDVVSVVPCESAYGRMVRAEIVGEQARFGRGSHRRVLLAMTPRAMRALSGEAIARGGDDAAPSKGCGATVIKSESPRRRTSYDVHPRCDAQGPTWTTKAVSRVVVYAEPPPRSSVPSKPPA